MPTRRTVAVIVVLLSAWGRAAAQQSGDTMIEKYLAQETAKLSNKVFDGAKSLEEWQARRPRLKEEYLYMLGLWPLPEKTPLHATVTGTLERDDFVVDKIHYQSKPGLYVTGNLYRPKASPAGAKLPAVLYVCGHSNKGRNGNKTAFQDHGIWFARNGYLCLVIDTLQLGEVPGVHHGTYGRPWLHLKAYGIPDKDVVETRKWWHAAGYTPAGVECWNGIRGIDYLIGRPDVDASKIAVTGISGGGAATFWIAAADERVRCAVPVSGMSDLESYVTNKVVNGHCDCMFLYNTFQWEWTTIAALVAPRPLLFANSDNDRIFPMDGNRRIIGRLRTLYQWHGQPDLVDDYVSVGGHDYRSDLRIAIFKWINKHIKGDSGDVKDSVDFTLFKPEELRVFPEDKDIPRDAINHKIDETFVPRAQVKLPEAGKFDEWKQELMKELRAKVFRQFPERVPPALKAEAMSRALLHLETEAGITIVAGVDPKGKEDPPVASIVVDIVAGAAKDLNLKELAQCYLLVIKATQVEEPVVVLPRGADEAYWQASKSPPNTVDRSHALLGRTVDQGRLWDVASATRTLVEKNPKVKTWRIVGRGQAGVLVAYAALFEPTIHEVVIIDPPASYQNGPFFLNVLRVLDVPEALGMLAPRPLTLINAKDAAFDRTAEIYRRAGAADKFIRK